MAELLASWNDTRHHGGDPRVRRRRVGSSNTLRYRAHARGGNVVYQAKPDVFDDGPVEPARIWSRIGRRPTVGLGNSNGDIEMLNFSGGKPPALRLLVRHDDPEREFAYDSGAERALEAATTHGWTIISVKNDWATAFGGG